MTLPTRFLIKTAHFVTFLALAFDIDTVVENMLGINTSTASSSQMDDFNSTKKTCAGGDGGLAPLGRQRGEAAQHARRRA